jgi:hypothetical protein
MVLAGRRQRLGVIPTPPRDLAADRRRPSLGAVVGLALVAGAVTYAVAASYTRPFTVGGDTVTAVPLAVAVVVMATRMRGAGSSDIVGSARGREPSTGLTRWSGLWAAVAAIAVSWELYCYWSTLRTEHPTLSTLIDLLDSTRIGKIAAFAR